MPGKARTRKPRTPKLPDALPPQEDSKVEPFEVIQFTVGALVIVRDGEGEVSDIRRIEIPVLQSNFSVKLSDLVPVALRQAQNPQQNRPAGAG